MKNDNNIVILIVLLSVFAAGFLVGKAIYDKRPITQEEYNELHEQQYYE